MRIVFCGSGGFAIPSLGAIEASRHEIPLVISQPSRPAGRGGHLRATPLAKAAREKWLEVLECPDINAPEAVERLRQAEADVLVVIDFGQFVRPAARSAVRRDAVNLHGSLLPKLRGAAPVNWAIIRGHRQTGVTTFSLVDRMDAGPIYAVRATDIESDETAEELEARLADLGAETMLETLERIEAGDATPTGQDESQATRAPRLTKRDGHIDWSAPARRIADLARGTYPWPGAQAMFHRSQGKPVRVTIARATPATNNAAGDPGDVTEDRTVCTGSGALAIEQIKPAGKRLMNWKDFVNGYRVESGDRFGSVQAHG